ncbi:UDP-glucose/GDP-mannose dehydrogenase family protein [Candidatus Uhrbacteria bacterium]|nr:UDP-glucose/GDP-mannose dehydrogenase family protein [Candidatus Uhrbacteria bacterium]
MNIVMIGTGYVGLTTGLGFASLGHRVACVDTDSAKMAQLDLGQAPFYEPGLEETLKSLQEQGQIVFTLDLKSVIDQADVIMIAVQTPPTARGQADLSYVLKAADQIGEFLTHEALVVVKSTVPVGTNRHVLSRIHERMCKQGKTDLAALIHIASIPEFLREGSALDDFMHPDRIVIGADDDVVFQTAEQLHQGIKSPVVRTSIESAELIKVCANAFLATKISFINEVANIVEGTGADVREIAHGIGLDRRIGPQFLRAGIGFGGSCFPKDVSALKSYAGINGYDFKLLSAVIDVNNRQWQRFFQKMQSVLGPLKGRRIGVWGLAFKPDTDDIRESAAIVFVQALVAHGAEVVAFDPKAQTNAARVLPDTVSYAPTAIDAASGADALVVLTEWPELRAVSFATLKTHMVDPVIFDGRNALCDLDLPAQGFRYFGIGIPDQHL